MTDPATALGGDDAAGHADPDEPHRLRVLRRYVAPTEQQPIAPVLGLTVLAIGLSPILADHNWSRGLEVALIGLSAIVALQRTGTHRMIRRTAIFIVALATLAGGTIPVLHEPTTGWIEVVAAGLFALLLLVTPVLVMIRLMLRPRITVDTLAGALTGYLQIGIFFGALCLFVSLVQYPTPYFNQSANPVYSDFEYFSFITLTTVGYGDLTPATRVGQTIATFEAVLGQVFLVTVVALTVSNLGRPTRRGGAAAAPDDPPATAD